MLAHPNYQKEYRKKWRARNAAKSAEYRAKYAAKQSIYWKKWYAENGRKRPDGTRIIAPNKRVYSRYEIAKLHYKPCYLAKDKVQQHIV